MYSIVMLMAMSGAPEMPAFGGRFGGCNGCNGGGWSCNGGNACCGCQGGGRMMFGGRGGCHGGRGNGCCGYNNSCGCNGYMASSCGCCGQMASSCGCCGQMASGCNSCGGMAMNTAAPATVVVSLPADAKLSFDNTATNSTSANRRFTTPALNADATYTLTAEIVRDGKTLTATQVITVRAGQTTEVNLGDAQFATSVVKN
jgi:uncharacterized protein (TIGR03000 family)